MRPPLHILLWNHSTHEKLDHFLNRILFAVILFLEIIQTKHCKDAACHFKFKHAVQKSCLLLKIRRLCRSFARQYNGYNIIYYCPTNALRYGIRYLFCGKTLKVHCSITSANFGEMTSMNIFSNEHRRRFVKWQVA